MELFGNYPASLKNKIPFEKTDTKFSRACDFADITAAHVSETMGAIVELCKIEDKTHPDYLDSKKMIELQKHMNGLTEALTVYMQLVKAYLIQMVERSQKEGELVPPKQQYNISKVCPKCNTTFKQAFCPMCGFISSNK